MEKKKERQKKHNIDLHPSQEFLARSASQPNFALAERGQIRPEFPMAAALSHQNDEQKIMINSDAKLQAPQYLAGPFT